MLSEVSFKSQETDESKIKPIDKTFDEIIDNHDNTIGSEGLIDAQDGDTANTDKEYSSGDLPNDNILADNPAGSKGVDSTPIESVRKNDQNGKREGSNQMFIGLVIGVLGVTVVLLMVTILIMYK